MGKDKKKFGGTGILKQSCIHRRCGALKEVIVSGRRGRPKKNRDFLRNESSGIDITEEQILTVNDPRSGVINETADDASFTGKKKPRIRISLNSTTGLSPSENAAIEMPIPKKRKKREELPKVKDMDEHSLNDGEIEESIQTRLTRKRSKHEKTVCLSKEDITSHNELLLTGCQNEKHIRRNIDEFADENVDDSGIQQYAGSIISCKTFDSSLILLDDTVNVFLDTKQIQNESAELDGSFKTARDFFTRYGPWKISNGIYGDKFVGIAKLVLEIISRHDQYSLFAKAVTEEEAPGYFDVVKKPMDFGTMRDKVISGRYDILSDSYQGLYEDFLLVMDNCALYNGDNEEIMEEAARLLGLLPSTFTIACVSIEGRTKRKSKLSKM